MKIGRYLSIVILTCIGFAFTTADAQENLAQQVSAIFQQNCSNCHGASGAFKEELLIDRTALIDTESVIPGDPGNSEFYKRLLGPTENGPQMPLNLPPLSPEAVETIARWIAAGAPDWNVQHDINFITTDTILDTIRNHLESLDPFDRPSARYFTMTHLYNAGETPETLNDYQIALSKLVNSLSWKLEITNPIRIDEAQTIFYIDLRRYEWNTTTDVWTQIEQAYPYNIAFDPGTQAGLLEKLTRLQTETGSTVPFVHVDWFLAHASLPPLYHDILGLPETDRVLEAQLGVNVASNIRNAPGIDVWRAGFNDSGVSANNRVVERHTSRYGAYWKSYDFAGSAGSKNIFTHPLDFTYDGGEIIFNLPNGLQAYLLVDANGNRLEDAPIDIVSNPAASDPTVRNGLSCIGCHTQGMKKFKDSVRAAIEQDDNPPYNKAQALRLYPEQSVLDALVAKDTLKFQQVLEKIGGPFADDASRQRFFKQHENEPIQRFHELFQAPLNAHHAAAAVGLETAEFLTQIREKQSLKNLGLQTLTDVNGTVKRDAWTSNFDDMISALNTPDSTLPPVVQRPELIPGESVDIPDPNLRAAIAEALGKTPGAAITVEDMATLTQFEAVKVEIQDLTGLQYATRLEVLKINGNPISDLSPLAGLITLKELNISWTQLSDLSPLPGLINLQHLEAWSKDNTVSDLSPLANLNNLIHLDISGSKKIKDISPLANLTKLNVLRLYDNAATDLSPLKNLVQLEMLFVEATHSVLDISPLANLTRLWFLHLASNKISDISSLSGLVALETLHLNNNTLTDISALASLHNLKWLALHQNSISDFSPIDGLRKNTEISWHDNPGFPKGGPKIESPWLWLTVPGELDHQGRARLSDSDLLAAVTNNLLTEHQIATDGATEGKVTGNKVWTTGELDAEDRDNINTLLRAHGLNPPEYPSYVIYGSTTLYSPRKQDTTMFFGGNDYAKIWMNGKLIHEKQGFYNLHGYQDLFPVTLKQGKNVLLVAIDNRRGGPWSGYFGFALGTEYTVSIPTIGYAFSDSKIHVGDTFTLDIRAENVYDLSGWQFDITFDPDVLEAVEVNEGDFLKEGGGTTFFQKGTIDNATGKITKLSSARLNEDGVTGTGTLLSVTFTAKAGGETRLALHNFELGSITGDVIPAGPHEVVITIEGQLATGDVNRDGQVSVLDLILVSRHLGEDASANPLADVNLDGVINIQDLLLVAQHLGESTDAAAPSAITINDLDLLDSATIQTWITQAQIEDDGSIAFQQAIANLEQLLTLFIPDETALLHNYPNPFNPETWIPYQLAEPAEVTLTIYAVNGTVVRRLALGHQPAGIYQTRTRAAYWDGKNDLGEPVASGVYFYTLSTESTRDSVTASDFNATRKMLIRK